VTCADVFVSRGGPDSCISHILNVACASRLHRAFSFVFQNINYQQRGERVASWSFSHNVNTYNIRDGSTLPTSSL
jgi:hypothetical protein